MLLDRRRWCVAGLYTSRPVPEEILLIRRIFLILFVLSSIGVAAPRRIVVISHRGEHLEHPENTVPAFEAAIRAGADFIEVDVRATSDGKLVLSHDSTVNRCTNGQGKIEQMTFDQVEALDAGARKGPQFAGVRIPTFDQVLDLARGRIGVYVDVKSVTARDLASHLEAHAMAEHAVIYCGLDFARELLALNPRLRVMPEASSVDHAGRLVSELHPKVIAFDARDFTPEIIAIVKTAGSRIYVDRLGAADNPESWQAAIDAGADGIQTDRPAALVEYLKAKGYR